MKAIILLIVFAVGDFLLAMLLPYQDLQEIFLELIFFEIAFFGCLILYDISKLKGKKGKKDKDDE